MTRLRSLVLLVGFVCAIGVSVPASSSQHPSSGTKRVAFLHASVIPMDKERVLRDYTVIAANGKIVKIGPSSAVRVPKGVARVDATGRYLLPALCDMHVHLLGEAWSMMLSPEALAASKDLPFEDFFFPYVANGVTTVQALSATPQEIVLRGRIARGELLGPRLILARMIDGPKKAWPPPISTWVATPAEARQAVVSAKDDGYDKIKVYSFLSKESYDAIMSTAREHGMDVIGHVPNSVSVEYVLDAGQKMIAHSEEISKKAGGNYSAEQIDYFATIMAGHGVWMTSTLVTTRTILEIFDDPSKVLGRPEAIYFRHPMEAGVWSFISEKLYQPTPPKLRVKIRDDFDKFQRPLTKAFFDKGGQMMTGTDAGFPGLVPGFALHRELRELVDVGLTPYQALRTATTGPFEYLGESDKSGTIEVGKQTDLLLVDENPLENISAASKISGVLIRGRWIGAGEIHEKMEKIAAPYVVPGPSSSQQQ